MIYQVCFHFTLTLLPHIEPETESLPQACNECEKVSVLNGTLLSPLLCDFSGPINDNLIFRTQFMSRLISDISLTVLTPACLFSGESLGNFIGS